jgi:threonine synthase
MFYLKCIKCNAQYPPDEKIYTCPKCGGLLEVFIEVDKISVTKEDMDPRWMGVWKYREFMPIGPDAKIVTLTEGGTPLHKVENLRTDLGVKEIYVKNEGANPSGSFKDRGMTLGVTKALELGASAVACASTGNTSASLASFAAVARLPCLVLLPTGKTAMGKLSQAILHGAKVVAIDGNFDDALELVRRVCDEMNIYLLNSINPWRLEGQKSLGFEIVDQLDWDVPDRIIVPVGNCGNSSAIWKGLKEFYDHGFIDRLPKITGIQADGAAPVVKAFKEGLDDVVPIENPETVATAIRIGAPVSGPKTLKAVRESGGLMEAVSDEEILDAQKLLARREGIGVEPASASTIAGLKKLLDSGEIDRDERIVLVATGHALKDPEIIIKSSQKSVTCEADIDKLKKVVEGLLN